MCASVLKKNNRAKANVNLHDTDKSALIKLPIASSHIFEFWHIEFDIHVSTKAIITTSQYHNIIVS